MNYYRESESYNSPRNEARLAKLTLKPILQYTYFFERNLFDKKFENFFAKYLQKMKIGVTKIKYIHFNAFYAIIEGSMCRDFTISLRS